MKLLCNASEYSNLKEQTNKMVSLTLTDKQLCDLELLLNFGFYH